MTGKRVLLWMRSKCESRKKWRLDELLDEAREDGQLGVSAAEEALRAVAGGVPLGRCDVAVVNAAIRRGAAAANDVAAANGVSVDLAKRWLGF